MGNFSHLHGNKGATQPLHTEYRACLLKHPLWNEGDGAGMGIGKTVNELEFITL